jgi:hypothetical protein
VSQDFRLQDLNLNATSIRIKISRLQDYSHLRFLKPQHFKFKAPEDGLQLHLRPPEFKPQDASALKTFIQDLNGILFKNRGSFIESLQDLKILELKTFKTFFLKTRDRRSSCFQPSSSFKAPKTPQHFKSKTL